MYITSCVSHIKLRGGCRCMLTHNQARKLCTHVSANLAHKTLKQVLPAAAQQLAQQNITSYQDTSGGTVLVKHRLRFRKHRVVHAQHRLTFILKHTIPPNIGMSWSLAARQCQAQLTFFSKYFSSVPQGTCPLSDSTHYKALCMILTTCLAFYFQKM